MDPLDAVVLARLPDSCHPWTWCCDQLSRCRTRTRTTPHDPTEAGDTHDSGADVVAIDMRRDAGCPDHTAQRAPVMRRTCMAGRYPKPPSWSAFEQSMILYAERG